jgi:hypothetical protein
MNPNEFNRWKSEVLDEVFAALAADSEIEGCHAQNSNLTI